mmetsp:Transcript_22568/g.47790  ORF Transcript_22568/g.47790 Transcript_22568/m.47790 type:complete len:80 (-) Transcript_22568:2911-3150(-)
MMRSSQSSPPQNLRHFSCRVPRSAFDAALSNSSVYCITSSSNPLNQAPFFPSYPGYLDRGTVTIDSMDSGYHIIHLIFI